MIEDKHGVVQTLLLPVTLSGMLMLTGCGGTFGDKTTDEAKKYEASQAIDSGDFEKAIELLEKDCAGYSYENCQLQLGQAYLGKAGFDVISLGRDMMAIEGNDNNDEAEKEIAMTTLIFDKLFDPQLTKGIQVFKRLLPGNGTECNAVQYVALTTVQKQACIAINPILMMEKLSDSDTQSTNTVDLETVLQFKSIVDSAIPGLSTEEFVNVVSGGDLDASKDVNGNGTPDQLEITDCVIKAANGDETVCTNANITINHALDETNVAIGSSNYNVTRVTMESNTSYPDKNGARLWISQALGATTVTLDEGNVTADGTTPCDDSAVAAALGVCYPKPLLNEDGTVATFNDTVVDIINDDAVIYSIAELSDTSDATSTEKVDDLKTSICGDPVCVADQEDMLIYMSTDK